MSEIFGATKEPVARLDKPITGKCLCGAVSVTLIGMAKEVDVCHCDMCRRVYGAFGAMVAGSEFSISGQANVSTYKSSDWAERSFCTQCGSALWYRFTPTDYYSFAAGHFELPAGLPIKQQIFIEEKPDWYDLVQECPMKTGEEVIAEAMAAGISFD